MCDSGGGSSGRRGGFFRGWGCAWIFTFIFFSSVGLFSLGISIFLSVDSISKQNWVEVDGVIIGADYVDRIGYVAIVQYQVAGQTYQLTEGGRKPTIGNEFRVIYDPNEPSEGVGGSFSSLWIGPIGCFGVFVVTFGVGIPALLCQIRKENNAANPSGQRMDTGNATSSGMGMVSSQPLSNYGQAFSQPMSMYGQALDDSDEDEAIHEVDQIKT